MHSPLHDTPGPRLVRRAPLLPFLVLVAAPAAPAQDAEAPRRLPASTPETTGHRELVAGGEVQTFPILQRDDDVPRPQPAVIEAGTDGDRVVSEAAGDPDFLGFAAGPYYPPAGESVDPLLLEQIQALPADRPGAETWAYVMFSRRITEERVAELKSFGARVVGFHPHYSLRVATPANSVQSIAGLDFVRWIGVPRAWQKMHPLLAERLKGAGPEESLDVYVSVFDSDLGPDSTYEYVGEASEVTPANVVPGALPDVMRAKRWQSHGWQQQALEAAGLEVVAYEDSIRAFRARVAAGAVTTIRDLDFVQFVELDLPKELTHDESMAMINADLVRDSFTGGTYKSAVVGEVDTGYEYSHSALNHVYGWGWDLAGTSGGPWVDEHGHGSHVAGTILAEPPAGYEEMTGVAPGLGSEQDLRVYNVKIFDDNGGWGGASLQDIFDRMHTDVTSGGVTTPRPHVVSNSWGTYAGSSAYIGTEADARLLDNEVYIYDQLYVFAAGNEGPGGGTLRLQPAAKNSFTVANVVPYESGGNTPGTISSSSSRGPCGDGRWKPNVSAPGTSIESVDANTTNGYTKKSGTSMATPHVSGVAAQLADRYGFLRYRPAALSAVMMATAHTKGGVTISTEYDTHLDTYGTGRVDAYRAIQGDSQQALYFWGFTQGPSGWTELPFTVGAGATRVSIVMSYHELSASSGASKALVNDLDMWIDAAPFASGGPSGDYSAQQSSVDNAEIRILNNPKVGDWKVKIFPDDVPSFFHPKVGVCVVVSYGDTTPDGAFTLTADKAYAKPGQAIAFTGSVTNPSYVADGVYLDASYSAGMNLTSSQVYLADGALADLTSNNTGGREVMLGNIVHGKTRTVYWGGKWNTEGTKTFSVNLKSDNMLNESKSVSVVVDGTAPGLPGNVQSTTHTPGAHSCATTVAMIWNPANDGLSGVAGYATSWTQAAGSDPGATIDTTGNSWTTSVPPSSSPWYFHVRAVDNAGNLGSVVHVGPFWIGQASATPYCNGNPNSTGQVATLAATGPICLATGQLTLFADDMPADKFGHFMMSQSQAFVPFFGGSEGNLCLGPPIYRFSKYILNTGSNGQVVFPVPFDDLPQGITIGFGETWNFQLWFRDKTSVLTSNTTNGLEVKFD